MHVDELRPEREEHLSLTMLPLDVLHTILLQRGIEGEPFLTISHQVRVRDIHLSHISADGARGSAYAVPRFPWVHAPAAPTDPFLPASFSA